MPLLCLCVYGGEGQGGCLGIVVKRVSVGTCCRSSRAFVVWLVMKGCVPVQSARLPRGEDQDVVHSHAIVLAFNAALSMLSVPVLASHACQCVVAFNALVIVANMPMLFLGAGR